MIKQAIIENFKSHEKVVLDFDRGLNVFVGATGSGKSAALGALIWAMTNKPKGEGFRSLYWDGPTKVTIKLIEGPKIIRERSNSVNTYTIEREGQKPQIFFNLKMNDVPEPVKHLINMGDINIQKQFDPPYILSYTHGQIAKLFNELVDLEVINTSLKAAASYVKKSGDTIYQQKIELTKEKEKLETYDWIDGLESILTKTENLDNKAEGLENKIEILTNLDCKYTTSLIKIKRLRRVLPLKVDLEKCEKLQNKRSKLISQLEKMEKLERDYSRSLKIINEGQKTIKLKTHVDNLLLLMDKENQMHKYLNKINNINGSYEYSINNIRILSQKLIQLKKKWKETFPEQCPLCDTPKGEIN